MRIGKLLALTMAATCCCDLQAAAKPLLLVQDETWGTSPGRVMDVTGPRVVPVS